MRTRAKSPPGVLGVYLDAVYRVAGGGSPTVHTNSDVYPFLRFVASVGDHFDELVLFGRLTPERDAAPYAIPGRPRVAPLPYYANLRDLRGVLRAAVGTVGGFWRGLGAVDRVVVFGPHPFGLVLIALALARGRPVTLGVRQDTMEYFRNRSQVPGRRAVLAVLWLIDRAYRLLARTLPTVVVGGFLERDYGGPRARLLKAEISLVSAADLVENSRPRDFDGVIRLLSVGRVEPEKNPGVLVEALGLLEGELPGRFELRMIGEGRLMDAVSRRAAELGVQDRLDLAGYIPYGPQLLEEYRRAHIFVHGASTEAMGQVLIEAMACGTAVVATNVGGVPDLLDGGAAGSLVRPREARDMAEAVRRLVDDPALRDGQLRRAAELARGRTLEAQAKRLADFTIAP